MIKKEKILSALKEAAQLYRDNLLDKEFLFIARNTQNGQYHFLEIGFEKKAFMHLTGIKGVNPPIQLERVLHV